MNHTLAFPIFEKDLNTFYGNACIVEFERINTNTQVNNADLCSLHTHTHTHTHKWGKTFIKEKVCCFL